MIIIGFGHSFQSELVNELDVVPQAIRTQNPMTFCWQIDVRGLLDIS
jgi:hypothetical protein